MADFDKMEVNTETMAQAVGEVNDNDLVKETVSKEIIFIVNLLTY